MHFNVKAMKLISSTLAAFLMYSTLYAFQDSPEFEVFTQLWFDQHLRNNFVSPNTPITELILAKGKFPHLRIKPDLGRKILNLEVYFTQQGILQERGKAKDNSTNTKHRFWKFVQPTKMDGQNEWVAELPIFSVDRPLWVYANIRYSLDEPITGAGYYYGTYKADSFVLSSLLQTKVAAWQNKPLCLPDYQSGYY